MVTKISFKFCPQQRLLTPADFKYTFDNTDYRYSTSTFLILVSDRQKNDQHTCHVARLGLVVAKKHLKRAVDRNRFKRVARDSFRLNQHALEGLDCVVLARSGVRNIDLANNELRDSLTDAWAYILRKRQKRAKSLISGSV